MKLLQRTIAKGFDLSTRNSLQSVTVGCSQCNAVCVNGTPTHEHGCPNYVASIECAWCGTECDPKASDYYKTCSCCCAAAYAGVSCGECELLDDVEIFKDEEVEL
jgi:hypothetical protein